MTVSYTESCLIWNVPNGAFPHLASSIHQPTIPSGIVILAIDKCTTDVKKKSISVEVAQQPLLKSKANLQAATSPSQSSATSPSQSSGYQPSASPSSDWARGRGRMSKRLTIQTLYSSKLLFLIRSFQNDTF